MMEMQWNESIGLGIPELDENYKQLIDILNYLHTHRHDGVKSEAISHVMEQIRIFATTHFPREEDYMLSVNYPEYTTHKKLHKQFREKAGTLCIDVMNHKEDAPHDIYRFLQDWIDKHLLRADKQIKTFLETTNQEQPPVFP